MLIEFWQLSCETCISESLPNLAEFHAEQSADRGRFEITSIYCTSDEQAKSVEAYDLLAAPIVEIACGGKPLPFPVLLDGEGKTTETYGVHSTPTVLLVSPSGILVPDGDARLLAEELAEGR